MAPTSESVDKILWCHHSNGTSLEVISDGAAWCSAFYKMKFDAFVEFYLWALSEVKWLYNVPEEKSASVGAQLSDLVYL